MSDIIRFENLTKEQQEAVKRQGTVLVSAAAGTGKTTTLLARIKYFLLNGIPLSRLLVLVYNESAAEDLKEKLRGELFNCACNVGGEYDFKQTEMFRKQLDELSFAHISTIHSFCQSTIRKNFEKLELSPAFTVLDERAHAVYMDKALNRVLTEYAESGNEIFAKLCVVFEKGRNEESLRANIFKLYALMDVQPDKKEFLNNVERCYSDTTTFDSIIRNNTSRIVNKVQSVLCDTLPFLEGTSLDNAQKALDGCKVLQKNSVDDILKFYDELVIEKTRKSSKTEAYAFYSAKDCVSQICEQFELYRSIYADKTIFETIFKQNAEFVRTLVKITEKFSDVLADLKRADNVLSFGDLEHKTVELIDGGLNLADEYAQVFVDEYQDVNPTQEYIISNLTRNNVFKVGDVKQSIYGFRLAAPEIFNEQIKECEKGEEGAKPIYFCKNFRSDNQILKFVNSVFDVIMTEDCVDVDYLNTGHFEIADDNATDNIDHGAVELHLFNLPTPKRLVTGGLYKLPLHPESEDDDCNNAENEARFIVSKIKELIHDERCTIYDNKLKRNRRLTFGDFVVLFRKRNAAANTIVEVMKKMLPLDDGAFTKSDVCSEKELINFLRVIDNPRQDYYLAGYMLSYFGGYSEDELASIAACRAGNNLYDSVLAYSKNDDNLSVKVRATLSVLDGYRIKASFKNVGELLSNIISETKYDAYLMMQGEAAVVALDAFVSSVSGDESLVGISKFLSEYGARQSEGKRSAGGNRVHVSTYHGYKGLEKPVVFVANLSAEIAQPRTTDLYTCGKGFIGISYFDIENKVVHSETLSKKALEFMIHEKEYKEEMRLLYVALTRAQKYLYLSGAAPARKVLTDEELTEKIQNERFDYERTDLEFIFAALRKDPTAIRLIHHTEPFSAAKEQNKKPLLDIGSTQFAKLVEGAPNLEYAYKEASQLAMKYSVSALENVDECTVRVYEERASVGTAYHKVMEHIDFNLQSADEVAHSMDELVLSGAISDAERALVKHEDIFVALSSPIMKYAANCKCVREKSFMMYVPASEVIDGCSVNDRVLVQGVIDLLIRGEKNIIVDYKYSALKSDEAIKKYEKQLKLYKMAAETAFSEKIDRICLLSLKTGALVEMSD